MPFARSHIRATVDAYLNRHPHERETLTERHIEPLEVHLIPRRETSEGRAGQVHAAGAPGPHQRADQRSGVD